MPEERGLIDPRDAGALCRLIEPGTRAAPAVGADIHHDAKRRATEVWTVEAGVEGGLRKAR